MGIVNSNVEKYLDSITVSDRDSTPTRPLREELLAESHRKLSFYESAGVFVFDARRFVTSGHSILSEIASLQNKVDAANRQYDLDSLPLLEQDVEHAKANARRVRDKLYKLKNEEIDIKRNHDSLHGSYKNAVNKLSAITSQRLDKFASREEIESHKNDIRKAQSEVASYTDKLSDEYADRNGYYNELAKLQAEYTVADNAVTQAKRLYEAVAKRVGVTDETNETNELGLS